MLNKTTGASALIWKILIARLLHVSAVPCHLSELVLGSGCSGCKWLQLKSVKTVSSTLHQPMMEAATTLPRFLSLQCCICFLILKYSESHFHPQSIRCTKPFILFSLQLGHTSKIRYILHLFSLIHDSSSLQNGKAHFFKPQEILIWLMKIIQTLFELSRAPDRTNADSVFWLEIALCMILSLCWNCSIPHYNFPQRKVECCCLMRCCFCIKCCSLQKKKNKDFKAVGETNTAARLCLWDNGTELRRKGVGISIVVLGTSLHLPDGFSCMKVLVSVDQTDRQTEMLFRLRTWK